MPIDPTKRKSRFWYGRGTHLGVSFDRSTGIPIDPRAEARSRETARAVCRSWERSVEELVIHGKKPVPTFAELAIRYLDGGGDPTHLRPLIDFLGDIRGDEIDRDCCDRAAAGILRPGFAPRTINRQVYTPVRAILNAAGLAPKIRERKAPRTERKWLTPEQMEMVLAAATGAGFTAINQARTVAVLSMLVGTGARPGELAALDDQHLYLTTAEAMIVPRPGGDKTALASRMLHLPDRSIQALRTYRGLRASVGGRVIDNGRGKPVPPGRAFTKISKTAFARAGLEDVTLYTLRHTWATWYYATTRDLRGLMDRGGWTSSDMAMHYTKSFPADLPTRVRAHGYNMEAGEYPGSRGTASMVYK